MKQIILLVLVALSFAVSACSSSSDDYNQRFGRPKTLVIRKD